MQCEKVLIVILVKDKEVCLPLYLKCIEEQTWPKSQTKIYIRTNDNTDRSAEILKEWIARIKNEYDEVFADMSNIGDESRGRTWTTSRFKQMARLRQASVQFAIDRRCSYFIADADNFIAPRTIESLMAVRHIGVVAPMLKTPMKIYSNYHYKVDKDGYYDGTASVQTLYLNVFNREVTGLIECDLVHCTYIISNEFLKDVVYDDESNRYEYVIFSDVLRKRGVKQYIDNRAIYGMLSFAETREAFDKDVGEIEASLQK